MKNRIFSLVVAWCVIFSTLVSIPVSATENESKKTSIENVAVDSDSTCSEHIWGKWSISIPATLDTAGTKIHTCQTCNETEEIVYTITDGGVSGEVNWGYGDDVLYITGTGEMANYTNGANGVPPWQTYRKQIKTIIIGDGVTYIGNRAFKGFNCVTAVTFGKDVISTGYECFYLCTDLQTVALNEGLETLGSLCFYNCTALTQVAIPSTVTKIENRVFKKSGLTSVEIPDAVTYLGYEVFMECLSLADVELSAGVELINGVMFSGCSSLTSIVIPSNIKQIISNAFQNCVALEEVIFENDDSLKATSGSANIASNAFNGCDKVTLKGWLNGLVSVFCASKGIRFQPTNSSIFKYTVNDDGQTITITGRRSNSAKLVIPESIDGYTVTKIGSQAFRNNAYITSVSLPSSLTTIGSRSFQNTKITKLDIPDSVTVIEYNAFQDCTALTNVSFGIGLTSINAQVFKGCTALGEIYVPNNIASIRTNAFSGCTNATIKTQSGSAAEKAAKAENVAVKVVTHFDYVVNADGQTVTVTGALDNTSEFDIPETIGGYTVTSIGKAAFRNATHITGITLPYTLTEISGRAFQNTGLTSIIIPQSVTIVDYSAFEDCVNLTEVVFWETPNTIHAKAFDDCTNLTFYGTEGSVVEAFANNKGFTFMTGRKYITYELPVININTNGQSITSKEDYVNMTFSIENCDDELIDVTGGIRLRGNSTFGYPKKPYRIKFDKKQSLFGLEKAKSWVLLAEWVDPSNLHNYTAFSLASEMPGFKFSPTPHKVNVYLNGEFKGLYTLCEQIQENSGRVDNELEEITESMSDLKDFNFLICMDYNVTEDPTAVLDETYYYIPEYDRYFELKYPEKDQFTSDEQFESFLAQLKQYTKEVMDAFKYRNAEAIKAKVNIDSLVNFLIIDQIMGEVDHRSKSFYMYYTGTSSDPNENNKLNFGPVWDYDFSLYTEWTSSPNQDYHVSDLVFYSNVFYGGLVDIPEFYAKVVECYETYALPALNEYIANFDSLVASMEESIELNNALWYEDKYGSEISKNNVDFLKRFLINRVKVLGEAWLGNK